jgi:glycosyltransferase involved in cell wall biosynthesis
VLAVDGWLCVLGYPEVVEMFSKRLRERTLVQPMVPWSEFRQFRRLIKSWDVGLAWVRDTPFNRCKSPLRALQLGMARVPVVASQCVYGEVLSGEYPSEYGLVVGDVSELSHAIVRSVEDREGARLRAEKWHTRVWQAHSLESQWVRWLEVYEGAVRWTKRD